jgi:hypothetical protein
MSVPIGEPVSGSLDGVVVVVGFVVVLCGAKLTEIDD